MCQRSGGLEGPATGLMRVCAIARECSALICQTSMEWQPLFRSAQERYQLDQDMLGDILVTTFEEVQEIAESLKVQMNRKQDLMDLMDKAHRALSELSDKILALEQGSGAHGMPAFSGLNRGDASVKETLQAVAHEIRNPLTAVGGFARRLSKSLEPASEEWRYAQVILEESDRLEKTLSSMAPKGGGKK
jgi:nitrogen-specific signal transduction histidine kinase